MTPTRVRAMPRPTPATLATAPRAHARLVRRALLEGVAGALWIVLGGFLYALGAREPVRPMLLWGGALPLAWGMTRWVIAAWWAVTAARRGS